MHAYWQIPDAYQIFIHIWKSPILIWRDVFFLDLICSTSEQKKKSSQMKEQNCSNLAQKKHQIAIHVACIVGTNPILGPDLLIENHWWNDTDIRTSVSSNVTFVRLQQSRVRKWFSLRVRNRRSSLYLATALLSHLRWHPATGSSASRHPGFFSWVAQKRTKNDQRNLCGAINLQTLWLHQNWAFRSLFQPTEHFPDHHQYNYY